MYFKDIDDVIATIKAATIKSKDCKKIFYEAGLPTPPESVIPRWDLCLELHCAIVNTFLLFVLLLVVERGVNSYFDEKKKLLMRIIWCHS